MPVVDPAVVLFGTALATAGVGAMVAGLASRGYRRHDSATMLFLAIGIAFITVGPFAVTYGVAPIADLTDAAALLGVLLATIAGLLSILYSLDGT